MVSKKRLNNGFRGFQVPVIPRAPRSIRRKNPRKKLVEDNQLCAFELLAAVAGKLLQESEGSACSNAGEGKVQLGINQDSFENVKPKGDNALKSDSFDHRSCAESAFVHELSVQEHNLLSDLQGLQQEGSAPVLDHSSVHTGSGVLTNDECDITVEFCEDGNADGIISSKTGGSNGVSGWFNGKIENEPEMLSGDGKSQMNNLSVSNTSTNDPIPECVNTNILTKLEGSVQLPLYRGSIPSALLHKHFNNVKIGNRDDDDENSYGCGRASTMFRSFRRQPNVGNRRIRKMLTSKYWRAAPKLKNCDRYDNSEGMKSLYRYRKSIYIREKHPRAPIKRRKLFHHHLSVAYNQEGSCESISNLPEKGTSGKKRSSSEFFRRECSMSSTMKAHKKLKDSHVRFSIKSFRVPELYVEVPETATVDSLKRTVLEAVTAILGDGIRVGVVLQGKKVRDENRTLQQAGISQISNLDALDFILEPNCMHVSPSATSKKPTPVFPCDADQELSRSIMTANLDSGISNASDLPLVTKSDEDVDKDLVHFPETPPDALTNGLAPYSKALVPVNPVNEGALALVPIDPKLKQSEVSQRRTRRPFSVAEVGALVEAIEHLGTGRWRDVKKRSFENADHRTYVDLKDKWKTLVHTASISPQQRRGELVPQELLNRVLSAHGYWSQHQSKQHGKHSVEPLKILDEVVGA